MSGPQRSPIPFEAQRLFPTLSRTSMFSPSATPPMAVVEHFLCMLPAKEAEVLDCDLPRLLVAASTHWRTPGLSRHLHRTNPPSLHALRIFCQDWLNHCRFVCTQIFNQFHNLLLPGCKKEQSLITTRVISKVTNHSYSNKSVLSKQSLHCRRHSSSKPLDGC